MDYDDFNGVVDPSEHDHNDSMENDLFAATINHSASHQASDVADADADETLWTQKNENRKLYHFNAFTTTFKNIFFFTQL